MLLLGHSAQELSRCSRFDSLLPYSLFHVLERFIGINCQMKYCFQLVDLLGYCSLPAVPSGKIQALEVWLLEMNRLVGVLMQKLQ